MLLSWQRLRPGGTLASAINSVLQNKGAEAESSAPRYNCQFLKGIPFAVGIVTLSSRLATSAKAVWLTVLKLEDKKKNNNLSTRGMEKWKKLRYGLWKGTGRSRPDGRYAAPAWVSALLGRQFAGERWAHWQLQSISVFAKRREANKKPGPPLSSGCKSNLGA